MTSAGRPMRDVNRIEYQHNVINKGLWDEEGKENERIRERRSYEETKTLMVSTCSIIYPNISHDTRSK